MVSCEAAQLLPSQSHRSFTNDGAIDIFFRRGPYLIKTASSDQEKLLSFGLRARVFISEYGAQLPGDHDSDCYDGDADHLLIFHEDRLIGTYRILSSSTCLDFYSEEEFNIEGFLAQPGRKIELSRACIDPDFRNGSVIALLWQGLYEYLNQSGADYLFGLSSVRCQTGAGIFSLLDQVRAMNKIDLLYGVKPRFNFDRSSEILSSYSFNQESSEKTAIPPLLRTYLKAGAMMAPVPAYDQKFKCFDFFTILKRRDLNQAFVKRLNLQRSEPLV